ncbi:MAG: hypothetical protein AUK16_02980 [Parcubacteria group bacterium CG2_30_44_11]|nr:MAG: hypothetical protein AUK16_02980 [Parcubacteria group bacterium CG2_30_44_11]
MGEIQFNDQYQPTSSQVERVTGLSQFFIAYSFGLITNQKQAEIAQIIICVVIFTALAYILTGLTENKLPQPTQDLIQSRQPIGPIN